MSGFSSWSNPAYDSSPLAPIAKSGDGLVTGRGMRRIPEEALFTSVGPKSLDHRS